VHEQKFPHAESGAVCLCCVRGSHHLLWALIRVRPFNRNSLELDASRRNAGLHGGLYLDAPFFYFFSATLSFYRFVLFKHPLHYCPAFHSCSRFARLGRLLHKHADVICQCLSRGAWMTVGCCEGENLRSASRSAIPLALLFSFPRPWDVLWLQNGSTPCRSLKFPLLLQTAAGRTDGDPGSIGCCNRRLPFLLPIASAHRDQRR
jgi:hypothetical protein